MAALDGSANAGRERGMSRRFAPRRLRARSNRLGQGAVCRAAGRPCRQLVRRGERRLSWIIQCAEYWSPAPAVALPARDVARCSRCCASSNKATRNLELARTNIADCSDLPLASNGSFGSALVDDQGNGADGSYRRLAASCPAKPRSRKASSAVAQAIMKGFS